jgi:aspartyl protease family protein
MKRLHSISLFALLLGAAGAAAAQNVALIGVIGDKAAVIALDGGDPKTVRIGQKWNGITVLSVTKASATIEVEGAKRTLALGQHHRGGVPGTTSTSQSVTLASDESGHFYADGLVNGIGVRFIVDTGATLVSLPGAEANRIGLRYRNGARSQVMTANGKVWVFHTRIDSLRVGGIELNNVEAVVMEHGLDVTLLGMSFLNRVEMKRSGSTMVLNRRF